VKVNLRDLRRNKGLTLKQASERAGITEGALSMIERGLRSPTPPVALRVLEALESDLTVSEVWPEDKAAA